MPTNPQELVNETSETEIRETDSRPRLLRMTRLVWGAARTMNGDEIERYAKKLEADGLFNDGFDPGEADE